MSYVSKHLLPGEKVMYETTMHWNVYVLPFLFALLICLPLTYFAAVQGDKLVATIPPLLAFCGLAIAHLRRMFSEYAVTSKRVIVKIGVMQTRSVELLLNKVEGITVNQGLGGKMFGYGEIVITGSGGTKETFNGIQSPFDFRRAVQSATDPAPTA